MLGEVPEVVKTGVWVGDCFIYTSSLNRLNYYVGGEIVTIAHLDRYNACIHVNLSMAAGQADVSQHSAIMSLACCCMTLNLLGVSPSTVLLLDYCSPVN